MQLLFISNECSELIYNILMFSNKKTDLALFSLFETLYQLPLLQVL